MNKINSFIAPNLLNTAVLFLVFNRIDTTKQVFESIRQAKPPRLYVASDGARECKNGEKDKVESVRDFISNNIDWECEVKTLYRDKNLGCKLAVSGAIDWFFKNEEMGIILEDDCLPSQSFFWFCEKLLERYKDDFRIWHITGNNFGFSHDTHNLNSTYSFLKFPQVWGWATWSNRWEAYDRNLSGLESEFREINDLAKTVNLNKSDAKMMFKRFYLSSKGFIDTWDYQWHATVMKNNGLCIFSYLNLISNLGDGADATHTKNDRKRTHLKNNEISFPIKHPKNYLVDSNFNKFIENKMNIRNKLFFRFLKMINTSLSFFK